MYQTLESKPQKHPIKMKNIDKQWFSRKWVSNLSINNSKQWTATLNLSKCEGLWYLLRFPYQTIWNLTVKIFEWWSNFPLNSIQGIIQRLNQVHCYAKFFKLWWFLLTFALKIFEILQFYDSKYSDKNQVTAKKEFSPTNKWCITLKGPKK